ncbi:MAG: hypothetical protein C0629_02950 [Chromatiales bacterium]|nr:MAG: hypothetical protein C0629_02950 [Chromatiales bacterium]
MTCADPVTAGLFQGDAILKGSIHAIFAASLLFGSIAAAEDASLSALKQRCEAAREAKIAPLRAAAIDECVTKQKKDRASCERFYRDYGNGGRTAAGAAKQRMFNDLPECLELYEAEKNRTKP